MASKLVIRSSAGFGNSGVLDWQKISGAEVLVTRVRILLQSDLYLLSVVTYRRCLRPDVSSCVLFAK